jgi:DNA-binding IclR family transcriptional regulator
MTSRVSPYPGAQAVARAVAVLKAFSDSRPQLTLAEITQTTRLNRATAYRLLAALEKEGLVTRDRQSEAYRLGPETIALGGRALRANDLRLAARPELEWLAQQTHETATLEVLSERDMFILDEVISPNLIGGTPDLGTRWPAHATSSGKAVLAFRDDAASALLRRSLPRLTPHTLVSAEALRRELARTRELGYGLTYEELQAGYGALSAPVRNHEGGVVAALCVGGPTVRLTRERLEGDIAPLVKQAAERVSQRVGFQPAARKGARR